MTKDQIKDEIIRKYEELVKSFGNCNCDICEKANSELASLKSRLAEEKEEDVYTKSLRLLTEFMDKTPSEEKTELKICINCKYREAVYSDIMCDNCYYCYYHRHWQPR